MCVDAVAEVLARRLRSDRLAELVKPMRLYTEDGDEEEDDEFDPLEAAF